MGKLYFSIYKRRWHRETTFDSPTWFSKALSKHTMESSKGYKWEEAFNTAVDMARKGGKEIMKAWDDKKNLKVKTCSVDFVTQTDKEVEKMISKTIREKFPTHSFIGEESVAAGQPCILTDKPTWIVDPVDGTTNFVHGFPFVAVSIAFAEKKQLEFGVVYICNHDWMYTGIKGRGAFCNGEAVQVSCMTEIKKSLIISERGYHRCPEIVEKVSNTMKKILCIPVHGLRGTGTAATNMCLVASGAVEAFFEIGIHCWDIAAGAVIVREAGGVLLDVNGKDFDLMSRRMVSANNMTIADRIIKEIEIFDVERDDALQGQQQQQQQQQQQIQ